MRLALNFRGATGDWKDQAISYSNLCLLQLVIGDLFGENGAVASGNSAVVFADKSGDAFQQLSKRATLASAHLHAGGLACAESLLRDAEQLHKKWQPKLPKLYGLHGYIGLDVLLARGRVLETTSRAATTFGWCKQLSSWKSLETALDTLVQARAALAAIPLLVAAPQNYAARSAEALAALRHANVEKYLVHGLLAHAEALWRCGDVDSAAEPLHEAEGIAARGPMPLLMTQAHLLRARIALGIRDFAAAYEKRAAAAALSAKHAYGRGSVELTVLDAELAITAQSADAHNAITAALRAVAGEPYHDARTGRTISGGWFSLLPRLEAILPARHVGLAELQAARNAYNAERDDYLRSTLAKDVPGYNPADDPITAYLAQHTTHTV